MVRIIGRAKPGTGRRPGQSLRANASRWSMMRATAAADSGSCITVRWSPSTRWMSTWSAYPDQSRTVSQPKCRSTDDATSVIDPA